MKIKNHSQQENTKNSQNCTLFKFFNIFIYFNKVKY